MISFLSVFPPFRGGISKFSHHLQRALRQHQPTEAFNFSVLYPRMLFPGVSQTTEGEKEVYARPVLHAYNPLNWRRAARTILLTKPRVLVFSFWHPFFAPALHAVIRYIKKRRPETEIVGIFHNILPHERFPFARYLTRKVIKNTHLPVVLSVQTDAEFRLLMKGQEPLRLFHPVYEQAVPEPDRNTLRKKYGFEPEDKVVLFYGLVRPYKGLDILIDALNLMDLGKLHIKPFIVGEFYVDPAPYLDKIKTTHLPYYEVINRYISDEEAAEILSISDVMVLPYRTASQSGVLMNAVNFHLPVIVSDLPGLVENIKEGETGFIFEPENPIDLARCIRLFFDQPDAGAMRGNVAVFKSLMSWERFSEQLTDLLHE